MPYFYNDLQCNNKCSASGRGCLHNILVGANGGSLVVLPARYQTIFAFSFILPQKICCRRIDKFTQIEVDLSTLLALADKLFVVLSQHSLLLPAWVMAELGILLFSAIDFCTWFPVYLFVHSLIKKNGYRNCGYCLLQFLKFKTTRNYRH